MVGRHRRGGHRGRPRDRHARRSSSTGSGSFPTTTRGSTICSPCRPPSASPGSGPLHSDSWMRGLVWAIAAVSPRGRRDPHPGSVLPRAGRARSRCRRDRGRRRRGCLACNSRRLRRRLGRLGDGLLRPIARAHLRMPAAIRTGTARARGRARPRASARRPKRRPRAHRRRGLVGACVHARPGTEPGTQVEVVKIEGATGARLRIKEHQVVELIVAFVIAIVVVVASRANDQDRAAGARRSRRASRPLQPHAQPWTRDRRSVHRSDPTAGRPARAGRVRSQPQPVITEDNLVVSIDTVIYFQVTDPKAATYEIANFIQGSSS